VTTPIKRVLDRLGLARPVFRLRERWRALHGSGRSVAASDGLAVPPARLMVLVTGSADGAWFLDGGRLAAASIRQALLDAGIRPADFSSILDFGCGCGRVIRHWRSLPAKLHGADCNPNSIAWCRRHLPFAEFQANTLEPRLDYADQQFDFAYALSVLTHTREDLQQPWMNELWRVLKPGGYLLITTQGEEYLPKLTNAERDLYSRGQVVVRYANAAGTNLCSSYHSDRCVRERLAGNFSVILSRPRAAAGNGNQDVYLLRRPR